MSSSDFFKMTFFIVVVVIMGTMVLATGCTDEDGAKKALHGQGFSDIELTGYGGPFACGEDDFSTTGFKAKNPRGQTVTGVVCCGMIMKSCTVRF